MKKRVAFETLGCKLNQFETDSLATQFARAGYDVVPYAAEADAYIVNTCTVTNKSDRKSRNVINRAAARRSGRAEGAPLVVVTGCFATANRSSLESRDDVSYVVDNDRKSQVFHIVDAHFRGEILDPGALAPDSFSYALADGGFHTRSMVKIQDGCDNFCTFCIIPYVRGGATSRPVPDVLDNVRRLVSRGSREIVLTGVNMGRYRSDGKSFSDLLEAILGVEGDFRVRISSLEPEPLDERFVDLLADAKMCPHLHLCLQSGSERILLRMRRMYTLGAYLDLVERIRARYPGFNLTTDVIVGFPGETEEDFEATARVAREVGFGHIHTFKYSRRTGTRADRMADQVPEGVKSERSEAIRRISEEGAERYRRALIGKRERVLVEELAEDGSALGYGEHYVPVRFSAVEGSPARLNAFYDARLVGIASAGGVGNGDGPVLLGLGESGID